MPEDHGEKVAGGEDGTPPGFMDMGHGFFVRCFASIGGDLHLYVLDRRQDRGGALIKMARGRYFTKLRFGPPDEDGNDAIGPLAHRTDRRYGEPPRSSA
jgi:hypothetical protein